MDAEEPNYVLYAMVGMVLLQNLFDVYLTLRQIKVYEKEEEVPNELKNTISAERFQKARIYGLNKAKYNVIRTTIKDVILMSMQLYCGFIAIQWNLAVCLTKHCILDADNEIIVSCMFGFLNSLIDLTMEMPFEVYSSFVLQGKHGFNNQTPGFFMWDQIKQFLAMQLLMMPIIVAIIFIIKYGGEHFFLWLWALTGIMSLMLLMIYPIFIAPLFDKYTPLEEGPLRKSIENLTASLKFPISKLYVVDTSKRLSHSNAYFYGLWNSKRVVFDTLLLNKGKPDESKFPEEEKGKRCTNEEILAVLGHELGHWKCGHVSKNIIIVQIHLFLLFAVFSYSFKYAPLYEAVGFAPGTRPVIVGLLVILTYVMAPYNAIANLAMAALSRFQEYQADEFAHGLGFSEELGQALIKLNWDTVYDWFYSACKHSHPTTLQRIERLKELRKSAENQKAKNVMQTKIGFGLG